MTSNAKPIATTNPATVRARPCRAVLFAGLCETTGIAGRIGDEMARAVANGLLGIAVALVKTYGGRVARAGNDGLYAVMPSADAAARAACDLMLEADWCGPQEGAAFGMHVGFHTGAFFERDGNIFGDAVNITSDLAGCAAPGQILTTSLSAGDLSPLVRRAMRRLGTLRFPGQPEALGVEEIAWRDYDESHIAVTEALHCADRC